MTTFPSITPNSRQLSLGDTPQDSYVGPSGVGVRFLYGQKRTTHSLSLSYASLTEAEISLLYAHYEIQQGTLLDFDLPAVIWKGYTVVPVDPLEYNWRYADTFQVEATGVNRFNVGIELESVIIYP
jgi:hypothetical protein